MASGGGRRRGVATELRGGRRLVEQQRAAAHARVGAGAVEAPTHPLPHPHTTGARGGHRRGCRKHRTDVYSFGMVLLELVRGRKNHSEHVSDGAGAGGLRRRRHRRSSSRGARSDYFPLMALEGLEAGQYAELGDPRLEGKMVVGEVERVIKVGLCCLHEDPQLRPSMAMVAGMLEGTMEVWEPRVQSFEFLRLWPSYMSSSQLSPVQDSAVHAGEKIVLLTMLAG